MTIEIAWASRRRRPRDLSDARIARAAQTALEFGRRPGVELSIVFVDDDELARMHEHWLDDPTRTDVITFDLGDEDDGPAGELYISTERAREVAKRRRLDVVREHLLYVVHGALHLCGYDDHEARARARMRRAERAVFERLASSRKRATSSRSRA